ncbi:hypothetical protein AAFN86_25850 [Roseomonas sp. CAU 1739]|uniref:hypothetical protein n=1 Tax=Roseomonas sp. CAU 1739 TaxID=3140364 RepID=UPI00325BE11B
MAFEPNVINVIPYRAVFTVDLRDPDEDRLRAEEDVPARYLDDLTAAEGVTISVERLARFAPLIFDPAIEEAAAAHGLRARGSVPVEVDAMVHVALRRQDVWIFRDTAGTRLGTA